MELVQFCNITFCSLLCDHLFRTVLAKILAVFVLEMNDFIRESSMFFTGDTSTFLAAVAAVLNKLLLVLVLRPI